MRVDLSKKQQLRLMEMVRLVLMSESYEDVKLEGNYRAIIKLSCGLEIKLWKHGFRDTRHMTVKTSNMETNFRVGRSCKLFDFLDCSRKNRLFNQIKEELDRINRVEGKSIISKVADAVDTAPALGFAEELDRLTAETASG